MAECGDVLRTGKKPGETGRVLLHVGGLRRAGKDGQRSARESRPAEGEESR